MAQRKKVLFFTNSEYGQANVMLSVIHELVFRDELEVHIASFSPLQPRISQLQERAKEAGHTSPFVFHEIPLPPMINIATANGTTSLIHPPGVGGAIQSFKSIPEILIPWTGTQCVEGTKYCMVLLRSLNPAIAIVDPICNIALDACNALSWNTAVLNPTLLKDIVLKAQPTWTRLLKFPT